VTYHCTDCDYEGDRMVFDPLEQPEPVDRCPECNAPVNEVED
jgi:DNA-directed RNA polymerase subunit RPC12/RpoP